MTTTNTFQGISDEGKPSSKVMRPPGGGSSGIFGTPYDAERDFKMSDKKRQDRVTAQANQPAAAEAAQPEASSIQHAKAPQTDTQANLFGGSAAPGGGKAKAQAYNPITGAPVGGAGNGDAGNQARNSSKVINPPGGKSSGLW